MPTIRDMHKKEVEAEVAVEQNVVAVEGRNRAAAVVVAVAPATGEPDLVVAPAVAVLVTAQAVVQEVQGSVQEVQVVQVPVQEVQAPVQEDQAVAEVSISTGM